MKGISLLLVLGSLRLANALQLLPPPLHSNVRETLSAGWATQWPSEETVYIEHSFAGRKDSSGSTLVPPSAYEFAQIFRDDLEVLTKSRWALKVVYELPTHGSGVFLGGCDQNLTYENGLPTEEGYSLDIRQDGGILIAGTGARGMWWGTRTLLQLLLFGNSSSVKVPPRQTIDAPAYATRGFMLDAGRKWYSLSFLKDLCTYASFFKMSEFHYHSADNYPLNRGHNETWYEVYSQFSMLPEDPGLFGLVQRKNETLNPAELEEFQQHCARRGVTVIPEIEAPGHALFITKWKPELALNSTKDLLNLTHPDSIPLIKAMWADFLPRLHSKEVHIGADEYDSSLADDYINFVNEISNFINTISGKRTRIWGTYEPSPTNLTISSDIIIQHWQYGQDDPLELTAAGNDIINSDEKWAYMSLKNDHVPISPVPYPLFFNETRILNFASQQGVQWDPHDYNSVNLTMEVNTHARNNRGAIMAAWNDNGPDATTQLEAYYAIRRGVPLVAARAWSGFRGALVQPDTIDQTIDYLTPRIPNENLDRVISSHAKVGDSLISWKRNSHDGDTDGIHLGFGSKGMNYTLTLSVTGPFVLSSPDVSLSVVPSADDQDISSLTFTTSDGWAYPLRSTSYNDSTFFPDSPGQGRIWAINATTSSHKPITITTPSSSNSTTITITTDVIRGSRCWLNDEFVGRFEVLVFGGHNVYQSWSQMAFVAPVDVLHGGVRWIDLKDTIVEPGT